MKTVSVTITSTVFLLLCALAFVVQAQTPEESQPEAPTEEAAQADQTTTAAPQQRQQSSLDILRHNRITNLAANISNRFDAAEERLRKIITRVETRIAKLIDLGADTSIAESHMGQAKYSLDLAGLEMSSIDRDVEDALSSENPKEDWATVVQKFLKAKTHLLDAQQSLREAVTAMKDAAATIPENSQTTDEVNAEQN